MGVFLFQYIWKTFCDMMNGTGHENFIEIAHEKLYESKTRGTRHL